MLSRHSKQICEVQLHFLRYEQINFWKVTMHFRSYFLYIITYNNTHMQSRIKLLEARFRNKFVGPSKPKFRRKISSDPFLVIHQFYLFFRLFTAITAIFPLLKFLTTLSISR